METKYFFVKINPCRPDFAQTLSEEERKIMQEHAFYWREYMEQGKVIVFGPVFDPSGAFGMGVVQAQDTRELDEWLAADPAGVLNKFEYHLMRAVLPTSTGNLPK